MTDPGRLQDLRGNITDAVTAIRTAVQDDLTTGCDPTEVWAHLAYRLSLTAGQKTDHTHALQALAELTAEAIVQAAETLNTAQK